MTTIANALTSLGVNEWVLRGEPTTEAEFASVVGSPLRTHSFTPKLVNAFAIDVICFLLYKLNA